HRGADESQRQWETRKRTVDSYLRYIRDALPAKSELCCTGISLGEIGRFIEWTEWECYLAANQLLPAALSLKQYRYTVPGERQRVVDEIRASWSLIRQVASLLELELSDALIESVAAGLEEH